MGKTALTLSMARNIAVMKQTPVAFSRWDVFGTVDYAFDFCRNGLVFWKIENGKTESHEWEQLNVKVGTWKKLRSTLMMPPFYFDYEPRHADCLPSTALNSSLWITYSWWPLELQTNREPRAKISTISRNLKALAKELDIPVIAFAALPCGRDEGRDQASYPFRLEGIGAIEQDADIVSFVIAQNITVWRVGRWRTHFLIGQAEFIVAKHRNGSLDNIRLKFLGHLGKFDNLETFDSPYEFPSRVNETIAPEQFPSAGGLWLSFNEDDGDVPFR